MERNKILVHQAFYGEVARAHACIMQTVNDSELTSFLMTFTDRPAALPPGVNLQPYLSGSSYLKYYIFTKTFPDHTATRAGMVFTHALILDLVDIPFIHDLQSLFSLFIETVDKKDEKLSELRIDNINLVVSSTERRLPKYIQRAIAAFISGQKPILFSGDISSFSNVIQQIWNSPDVASRKELKFRVSFSKSDIENIKDLTIVSIQNDFLQRWQGQIVINGEDQDMVEITSHSEALFLGYKDENPFYIFLIDLGVNLADAQSYGRYEKIFTDYVSIDCIEDANVLRQDIRTLSKISPEPTTASKIKEKFIKRISLLIEQNKDTNIKALRNIELTAFDHWETQMKEAISDFISYNIGKGLFFSVIEESISIACTEEPKNWWHLSIQEYFKTLLEAYTKNKLENYWQFLNYSKLACVNALTLLPATPQNEQLLRDSAPVTTKSEITKEIIQIASEKRWYLLHADFLLREFSPDISLQKQIDLESVLPLTNSVGVKYLATKLASNDLLKFAVTSCNPKLIDIAVEEILKDFNLLEGLNVADPCWLKIWVFVINKTKNVFNGLRGKEYVTVFAVLDLLIDGKPVDESLIASIAETKFCDISDYNNRSKIWTLISPLAKKKFLDNTAQTVLQNFLLGNVNRKDIETELSGNITSTEFITKFLRENNSNIESVITLYSNFDNLRDDFLADYISFYRSGISEEQSKRLGELVKENNFTRSARKIYDKSRYNYSFRYAFEKCKDLVSLNWWESVWGSRSSKKESQVFSIDSSITSKGQKTIAELPTVVILTAINEEYLAVRKHLKEIVEADQNDTIYEAGIFEFAGGKLAKVIIRECGQKNTNASQEAERAIQYFSPDVMLFVGIAGSRKPNDFSIGDVIFPEKVYSYEGGKSEKESFVTRPDLADMSYTLKEIAKKERRKDDWKTFIKGSWEKDFKADLGVIASGEKIIEHYDSSIGKILSNYYNDTSAVEMEGFGFANAANRQGRGTNKILIGIIRGISDIIEQEGNKNDSRKNDRRPANAKKMASDTAAAFTFWLILKLYN